MEKQIKPCPFCGCIPEIKESCVNFSEYSINGFKVSCECGVETRTKIYDYDGHSEIELKTKVIDIWNKRAHGWISVKDRLPDCHITVLGYTDRIIFTRLVIKEQYKRLWAGGENVLYWMPLPEPPK